MAKINSVLGPISPDDLGLTLAHEHIAAAYSGWECDALSRPYNREKIVNICLKALTPIKEFGVKSIVDATSIDLGRDVEVMKEVAEKLQINIICSTGMYTEEMGKWAYLKQRRRAGIGDMATELYDTYLHEITKGIGGSGVKAGVIKVATGLDTISDCEMASLKAAARAQKETGVPIITHTEDGTMGPEQVDVLLAEGADPDKIQCGHMCGNPSLDYQLSVLKKGVNIAFDRFGIEYFLPDSVRTANLISLLQAGYEDHILLSQDFISCGFGRGGSIPADDVKLFVNWSFTNIFRNVIPALKKAGISDRQIQIMTIDNPRRLFS
ncbi:MAG: phosphotriesterase family protein [Dehalococcoidia bacterium]